MQIYPCKIINNHLVANIDNLKAIIDTGSPISLGNLDNISIGKKIFNIKRNLYNITKEKIENHLNFHFDLLLGCDILNEFDIYINSKTILLDYELKNSINNESKTTHYLGVPVIPISYNNKNFIFFFDTGSWLSYFNEIDTATSKEIGEYTDFYPIKGKFITKVYASHYNISNTKVTSLTGILPDYLNKYLAQTKVNGILGLNILNNFNIFYSFKKKLFCLCEN